MDNPKVNELAALLGETKDAHHQAFLEVNGADPEWPVWYADRLHEPLSKLLGSELTRSQIVYELIRLSQESDEIQTNIVSMEQQTQME